MAALLPAALLLLQHEKNSPMAHATGEPSLGGRKHEKSLMHPL